VAHLARDFVGNYWAGMDFAHGFYIEVEGGGDIIIGVDVDVFQRHLL